MKTDLIISEGIESTFHYHLSDKEKPQMSLCGAWTFRTSIPLRAWGIKTELKERYCEKCKSLFDKRI